MRKLLFILNPVAGGGTAAELEELLEECLDGSDICYEIVLTTRPGHAVELCKNSQYEYIVAVGGDGTINEVARGMIERGYGTLGIIPGGTGNDLSRSLGIPLDPKEALKCIKDCHKRDLNVCKANGDYFLNISSIGFDAEVVDNASKIKYRVKSHMAYFLSVLYTFIIFRKRQVEIEIDGSKEDYKMVLLAVGSGNYYGGGMQIMPHAKLDDGYLHSTIIKDASNLLMFLLLPTMLRGSHIKYKKYVKSFKAKEIRIKSKEDMKFNLDGEILNGGREILFEISPKPLSVIYPKK